MGDIDRDSFTGSQSSRCNHSRRIQRKNREHRESNRERKKQIRITQPNINKYQPKTTSNESNSMFSNRYVEVSYRRGLESVSIVGQSAKD